MKNAYKGYRSFEYLKPGADYQFFDLRAQPDPEWAYTLPLDADEEERVDRIVSKSITISMHEHVGLFPSDVTETPEYLGQGRMATAFEALASSDLDAVFDGLMDGLCQIHSPGGWKWDDVLHDLGMRLCDLAHQDFIIVCRGVDDIVRAHREERVAWIPSIEGAAMIENELDRIDLLYGFGVRSLGITYSQSNALGTGLKEPYQGGLTHFGRRAVERMNKLGMLIDCSHASDQTTLDTVEVSDAPIVLSHIGARELSDSRRLAPDHVLEAVASKGGVIGVEAAPHTTVSPKNPVHGLESYMDHFQYLVNLVGIDHVGFGPDAVYGDHVGLHNLYSGDLALKESRDAASGKAGGQVERVDYVKGLENPTEAFTNISRWLVANGYSDTEIEQVLGGNVLRILREVWA